MDEHNEQSEAKTDEEIKDLDVDQDEADKVMGGARRADPCDGGE